jgi:hypothetical protein
VPRSTARTAHQTKLKQAVWPAWPRLGFRLARRRQQQSHVPDHRASRPPRRGAARRNRAVHTQPEHGSIAGALAARAVCACCSSALTMRRAARLGRAHAGGGPAMLRLGCRLARRRQHQGHVTEQLGRLAEAQHSASQHGTYGASEQTQQAVWPALAATGFPSRATSAAAEPRARASRPPRRKAARRSREAHTQPEHGRQPAADSLRIVETIKLQQNLV